MPASPLVGRRSSMPDPALATHRFPPPAHDDEIALAEQLLRDSSPLPSRQHSVTDAYTQQVPRWASIDGAKKWQARVPWWGRPRTWMAAALLFVGAVVFGSASARPDVREYVKDRVQHYTAGHAVEAPYQRVNGTIVILVNPYSNMYQRLLLTLQNIEMQFNAKYGYPIQLLTDGALPSESIMNRTSYITGGKATWSVVTPEQGWGPPSWIKQEDIDASIAKISFNVGYRNMCRFFAMWHYKHPAVRPYDYIFRLDDGIRFHCELMVDHNATYGWTNTDQEAPFTAETLWSTSMDFMRKAPRNWFPAGRDTSFVSDDGGLSYNWRMYYNNFEIVKRSFFESEAYEAFVAHLDRAGGFYKERWGDAPIRTIAASYLLPASEIYSFRNVTGYQHDNPPFFCPDLPYCTCNPEKSEQNAMGNW
ncbi:hypothetical protein Rhopal_007449-T1 [Rhodotorula paludigena]|uniref:Glycosyltransferase family 15 protein n=1 Tax=Rhodotorula paludigena TaxID=86838 RepID=A0AAV5GP63_9BASI|nr:hypothetical protein Rhopal_007449-T1 [Rhodotorula paludigena]